MKEEILAEIHWELEELIDNLSMDNLEETSKQIDQYLVFLKALKDLPIKSQGSLDLNWQRGLEEIYDQDNNLYQGQVHLILGGAELGSFKLFIPERLVRQLALKEGDWVQARIIDQRYHKGFPRPIYDYELLARVEEPVETKRRVLEYLPVAWDEEIQEQVIYWPKTNQRMVLNQQRLGNLIVQEGDRIDYAYYEEDPLRGRVIWRYKPEEEGRPARPKGETLGAYRAKTPGQGRTIVVFGRPDKKASLDRALAQRGDQLLFYTGQEEAEEIFRGLDQADQALVFIDQVDQDLIEQVADLAQEAGIETNYSRTIGVESFLQLLDR